MARVPKDSAAVHSPSPLRLARTGDPVALPAAARHIPSSLSHREDVVAKPDSVKLEARNLVDRLPDDASWEDLMYQVYVRESIDAGIRDVEAGRVVSHEEAVRRLLAPR